MAEDEAENNNVEEGEDDEEEEDHETNEKSKKKKKQQDGGKKKECNTRIEELSKPKRWAILGTYRDHADTFEPKRMRSLKERVQEAFSMSPEETEMYFASLRQKPTKKRDTRADKKRIRKEKEAGEREAYHIFYLIIYKAMKYAYTHAPPLLVTPMLRIVSDHVLELLADLHSVEVPKRTDSDNLSQFLIAVSDWTAIFVSNVYYDIEIQEQKDIERYRLLNQDDVDIESESTITEPLAQSTPVQSRTKVRKVKAEHVAAEDTNEEDQRIQNAEIKQEVTNYDDAEAEGIADIKPKIEPVSDDEEEGG